MSEKKIITKDTKIGELLEINDSLGDVLMGFGMHCISCPLSQNETLEEAGMVHGIDIDFLVKKLNEENK